MYHFSKTFVLDDLLVERRLPAQVIERCINPLAHLRELALLQVILLRIENLLLRDDSAASQGITLGETSLRQGLTWRWENGAGSVTRRSTGFKLGIDHAGGLGDSEVAGNGSHHESGLGELLPPSGSDCTFSKQSTAYLFFSGSLYRFRVVR